MSGDPREGQPVARGLVLVGFMACGKSSVGLAVARRLRLPFVDSDAVIEERHGPIPGIFERQGEASFRALERDVVLGLLTDQDGRETVISLGGGAVTDPDVRAALRAARVVWLAAPLDVLWRRATGGAEESGEGPDHGFASVVRPLARDEATFRRLFAERETLYREVADVTVDATLGFDVVVDEVVAALRRERAGRAAGGAMTGGDDAAPAG